ncbi:CubicO group peptidase (beta-lactamase class C family) [Chryseobacterium sp. 52]|uniref:serine hydrolase domain-containing protein n=1 Tax=Chryseobacterium sp. 52 TaxID=2035213 RepID=UPI000C1802AD|nr:serine hydrolase domain-containing protein [Chryseobacterium sp. 52]PIF43533.1 CubicO group peptidase (beta-lactamase class C family) [Chryseobacterium sp. 52]
MTKTVCFTLLLLLLFFAKVNAQSEKVSELAATNSILDNDTEIENWLKELKVPALGLGIIEDGKLKQIKVFGTIKENSPAPYNTIFNVASLTKPITAMVALHLVSLGKWDLDEPVNQYWTDPDIANDPRNKKLTTRIILSHQTGFPNWRYMKKDKKLSFDFDPGTKFQYSGEGFEYLRKAIENKFKKPIQQLAKELIFQPLKMNDTNYIWDKNTDKSRFAIGYDKNEKPYEVEENKHANGADDLHTTIEDYGNFLANILDGGDLNKAVYLEMIKRQIQTGKSKYFGLGFVIYDLGNGEYALSHGGSDEGTFCLTLILPKTKQGILIFTNSDNGYKTFDKLLPRYLGENGKKIVEIETK